MLLAITVFIDHDGCPALHYDLNQYEPIIGANFIQVASNGIRDPPARSGLGHIAALGPLPLGVHHINTRHIFRHPT